MTSKNDLTDSPEPSRRVALVTGAAKGIGAAVAQALAEEGCNVVINHHSSSSKTDAENLANELNQNYGVETHTIQCDVSNYDDVKQMVADIKDKFGRIDILVNNAGITSDGLLMRMSADQFTSVVDTNMGGAFNCMRHVVPLMVKQRFGRIVNISSVVALYGNAGQVNYAASKAGIIGMTKSAAKELGSRNITVNAIAPGFIQTSMTEGLDDAANKALTSRISLGRLGEPKDVADAVAFLTSDSASYITGQVLAVDGGMSL